MAQTVQLRGQGVTLTAEEIAIERARVRMAQGNRGASFDIVWSPEETAALRRFLADKR